MFKKNSPDNKGAASAGSAVSYTKRPGPIGPILKQKAEARGLKPREVAKKLNIKRTSVYHIYKTRKYLRIPEMYDWSELLGENLFLLYHPNVEPLPNPLQEELDKKNALIKHLEEEVKENAFAKNRCIKLEAQVELLQEQLAERRK